MTADIEGEILEEILEEIPFKVLEDMPEEIPGEILEDVEQTPAFWQFKTFWHSESGIVKFLANSLLSILQTSAASVARPEVRCMMISEVDGCSCLET
jgi:hypothetical protein